MTVDPDDLREVLTIYHREFFLPDLERIFAGFGCTVRIGEERQPQQSRVPY
jgi:hypothetical protein